MALYIDLVDNSHLQLQKDSSLQKTDRMGSHSVEKCNGKRIHWVPPPQRGVIYPPNYARYHRTLGYDKQGVSYTRRPSTSSIDPKRRFSIKQDRMGRHLVEKINGKRIHWIPPPKRGVTYPSSYARYYRQLGYNVSVPTTREADISHTDDDEYDIPPPGIYQR